MSPDEIGKLLETGFFNSSRKATQEVFSEPDRLATDQELAALGSDPRFAKVAEAATRNLRPRAYHPLNRQFDFWLSEWRVLTADGGKTWHVE